jgi:hypothetical protein
MRSGPNLVPNRYRGVSVATVPADVPLDEEGLRGYLLGRDAYRRTRFVVCRRDPAVPGPTALVHVSRASDTELFSPVVGVELLAGPERCTYVVEPEADTGIPSVLAAVARGRAPGSYAVVVQGRYEHVNFIVDPRPLRLVVREVVPPEPAKLADQVRRIIAVTETLPPIEVVPELTRLADLAELSGNPPGAHYLLPCRGAGGEVPGSPVSYLDEHPERADWTLLGCERSRMIHHWFYGEDPPRVDLCPKQAVLAGGRPADLTLTKCCLQEEHVDAGDGWVCVPWGSSLDHIREALARLVAQEEPAWQPV